MAPLIDLQDSTVQKYFQDPAKQELLTSSLGKMWQQDVLGGDGRLSPQELKDFCDRYQPQESCKDFLKKLRQLPRPEQKITLLDWMFQELNRPKLEVQRQFWQIQQTVKQTQSSFNWTNFEKEAFAWLKQQGYTLDSPQFKTLGTLLRTYLTKKDPPEPEVLAHLFALGSQVLIIQEKLKPLQDFKGKKELTQACTTILQKIQQGKLTLKVMSDKLFDFLFGTNTAAGYYHHNIANPVHNIPDRPNVLLLRTTKDIFTREISIQRLHEAIHFAQDVNCSAQSQLITEYEAYYGSTVGIFLLFPQPPQDYGPPVGLYKDPIDFTQNMRLSLLKYALDEIVQARLNQAKSTTSPLDSPSKEIEKLEKNAKAFLNLLYSIQYLLKLKKNHHDMYKTSEKKKSFLKSLPPLDELIKELESYQEGFWHKVDTSFYQRSTFHKLYERLALEYELTSDKVEYLDKILIPTLKKLWMTKKVLIKYEGVDEKCPLRHIPLLPWSEKKEDPYADFAIAATAKPIPTPAPTNAPKPEPENPNNGIWFGLSIGPTYNSADEAGLILDAFLGGRHNTWEWRARARVESDFLPNHQVSESRVGVVPSISYHWDPTADELDFYFLLPHSALYYAIESQAIELYGGTGLGMQWYLGEHFALDLTPQFRVGWNPKQETLKAGFEVPIGLMFH